MVITFTHWNTFDSFVNRGSELEDQLIAKLLMLLCRFNLSKIFENFEITPKPLSFGAMLKNNSDFYTKSKHAITYKIFHKIAWQHPTYMNMLYTS